MSRPFAKVFTCSCGSQFFAEVKRYAVGGRDMDDDNDRIACQFCHAIYELEVNQWVRVRTYPHGQQEVR